jgi:RNA polymerase sigma factor (sigma-70 family)
VFPSTRHSILRAIKSADVAERRIAWEVLVASYWRPVYKYLRLRYRLSPEDAEDVTQGFFARALEKDFFERYDPAKARFRTFLRACVDGFAANEWRKETRQKRGGGVPRLSLDFASAEGELARFEPRTADDPDECFRREWVRSLFALALQKLEERCLAAGKPIHLELFRRYDVEGPESERLPSYDELAREYGLPVTQVTNYLAWARREFRALVLATLRELTASDEEFRSEAQALLGITQA